VLTIEQRVVNGGAHRPAVVGRQGLAVHSVGQADGVRAGQCLADRNRAAGVGPVHPAPVQQVDGGIRGPDAVQDLADWDVVTISERPQIRS
jgi:hypothetical protein